MNSQRIGGGPKKFAIPNETKTSRLRAATKSKEVGLIEKSGFADPKH
jgi:hypothetical protein